MSKERMEAFSDGVFAVIITIMVLDLKVPASSGWAALLSVFPTFLSYVLSFVFIGIYWNNHHHLLHAAERVDGAVLWANLHLLFWLSLVPFATAWMGATHYSAVPVFLYGALLLLAALAYYLLTRVLVHRHGTESRLVRSVGRDTNGLVSLAVCAAATGLAFAKPVVACAGYAVVALLWIRPDARIERTEAR